MVYSNREKLGIDLKTLETISWNDVVQRLIKLHEHKIYRVAVKDRLSEHDVVSRVMRKENYMIALINKVSGLLNDSLTSSRLGLSLLVYHGIELRLNFGYRHS